ncbi:MAG: GNAT family N-acetyltransferase [Deltaproteobacteria bacterium]|nr:GNAT family N-acetyltransferase [Deltaproteobacteria bacterium]
MVKYQLRPLTPDDKYEYSELLYGSFNYWYRTHGWPTDYFKGGPRVTEVFFDVYNDLNPGCNVAAVNSETGMLMGSCFYHPRERHVSLGIMSVHQNYCGLGIGKALVNHIIDFTEKNGYKTLRLVGSAINMNSFSLYNRAGFVPRHVYHDMVVNVPLAGMKATTEGRGRVRDAVLDDIPAMAALELEVSGITREKDYRYCIENKRGYFHASVLESPNGGAIEGFMISVRHPALNMLGPCVARTEDDTAALILKELDRFKGLAPLMVIPMDRRKLVETLYSWGAINVETHLFQVRGEFQQFNGVNLPSFLPETG